MKRYMHKHSEERHYRIIGKIADLGKGMKDMELVYLECEIKDYNHYGGLFHGAEKEDRDFKEDIEFFIQLPVYIQATKIEKEFVNWIIYQCEEDKTIWARDEEEFFDGRFYEV